MLVVMLEVMLAVMLLLADIVVVKNSGGSSLKLVSTPTIMGTMQREVSKINSFL